MHDGSAQVRFDVAVRRRKKSKARGDRGRVPVRPATLGILQENFVLELECLDRSPGKAAEPLDFVRFVTRGELLSRNTIVKANVEYRESTPGLS